jgi:peptidoglycan/xylan/chitin deacetylase (PgdA/CDA1 family)
MKFFKTPNLIKYAFPHFLWSIPTKEKVIYVTFDDGPTPIVTPYVLDLLKQYHAQATFFCIGEKVVKYDTVFNQILAEKHTIGNHTFNHLKGWGTKTAIYLENILKADEVISPNTSLFRPPYGKIAPQQVKAIKKKGFNVVMWDVLSYDFEKDLNHENALKSVIKHTRSGSIIVFHDSEKAFINLQKLLPAYLDFFSKKGFVFKSIPSVL